MCLISSVVSFARGSLVRTRPEAGRFGSFRGGIRVRVLYYYDIHDEDVYITRTLVPFVCTQYFDRACTRRSKMAAKILNRSNSERVTSLRNYRIHGRGPAVIYNIIRTFVFYIFFPMYTFVLVPYALQ